MLDIDRLHRVIEQYTVRDGLAVTAPVDVGVTTAFEQLMLAEAQLVDFPNRHFIYLADNEVDAAQMQYRFVKLVQSEPGIIVRQNQRGKVQLNAADVVFFFVGVEYFAQRFAFMGTRVDKVFVDVSQDPPQEVIDKLLLMQERGTEIE